MKKRLNRFVVDDEAQGRETTYSPEPMAASNWRPFPPPALLVSTTSPSAIPVGPAFFLTSCQLILYRIAAVILLALFCSVGSFPQLDDIW